jgi:hypothetical protein
MIRMFIDLCHDYIPMVHPFVALVITYLLACVLAWCGTRERGFLVAGATGALFLVPYFAR